MSRHPKKGLGKPKPLPSPTSAEQNTPAGVKVAARSTRKPISKNQKEVVIQTAALRGKGYPSAMNLDVGTGKPAAVELMRTRPQP